MSSTQPIEDFMNVALDTPSLNILRWETYIVQSLYHLILHRETYGFRILLEVDCAFQQGRLP